MKQRVILIVSVVVGLIAALLTGQYLNAKDREYRTMKAKLTRDNRTVAVIAVRRNLPAGTVLIRDDLGATDVPESIGRRNIVALQDANMVCGKKLARSLEAGTAISWLDLEGGDPLNNGLASDINNGQRAISISVGGAAAVSGMVRPNDHVDVLGTFSFPAAAKGGDVEMVTLTLLQNVLILATGRDTAKNQINAADRTAGGYSTVTIEVSPREAEMLVFAEQARGRLVLTLRHPADVTYLTDLPRVDFSKIHDSITTLNRSRQEKLMGKPSR